MSDAEARELLRLLHKYCTTYEPDLPQTITTLAEDLVNSDPDAEAWMLDKLDDIRGMFP